MFGKRKPEILIAGAGPVGLFAALHLARKGVRVEVVDEAWRPATHSYALALHGASLALLDEMGLLEKVLEHSYRVHGVGLYEGGERKGELRLLDLHDSYNFAVVTRQDVLEDILEQALREAGVKVRWSHRAALFVPRDERVQVDVHRLEKESVGYAVMHTEWIIAGARRLEPYYVIGADGHRSLVRRQSEIDFPEVGPAEQFAVFEFETDTDLQNEMRVAFFGDTTNVLWPLPHGRCRWSFQIDASRLPEDVRDKDRAYADVGAMRFPVLDEGLLAELIAERAPWFDGDVARVHWRMAVRFEKRLAGRFGGGRIWLAGDAGHMTGPVGAQSMNVGLREAYELADTLVNILHHDAPPELLEEYDQGRRAEWRTLLGLDDSLHAAAETDPWIATHAGRLLSCIPASGDGLAALAAQVGLSWAGRAAQPA